eukprot:6212508-Pleurochrysis_carterae.AAC.1
MGCDHPRALVHIGIPRCQWERRNGPAMSAWISRLATIKMALRKGRGCIGRDVRKVSDSRRVAPVCKR